MRFMASDRPRRGTSEEGIRERTRERSEEGKAYFVRFRKVKSQSLRSLSTAVGTKMLSPHNLWIRLWTGSRPDVE